MSEIKPWPLFGYAPGGYLIQCIQCNTNHHTGAKRAVICGDCAAVLAKSRIEALEKENAELRKTANAVISQWDTPNWKLEQPTAVLIENLRSALRDAEAEGRE